MRGRRVRVTPFPLLRTLPKPQKIETEMERGKKGFET